VIWTEKALADLNDIAEYIAISNLPAAKNLVASIFTSVERLSQHPESGRKPPEIEHLHYREIIFKPCRIFYKVEKEQVYILYVMRQERELRQVILNDRS
jgi:addiction module toxin, RelE/StbE family